MVKKNNHDTCKSTKQKEQNYVKRWSASRYEQAEESILTIMKNEGATFGNPISRASLRAEARKFIGDTGLLDHLLKHTDGKVAPGGCERFRRWHNSDGRMEYWLESVDLFDIRKEAGIRDPFWTPPPGWKPGCCPSERTGSDVELKILREEMNNLKRFSSACNEKADKDVANHTPNSLNALASWREKIEKQLHEITGSLGSIQDACVDLDKWKGKIDQKLLDMSVSVSSMQTSRTSNTFPSIPDNLDFFSNSYLARSEYDDFASWLDGSELIDLQQTEYSNAPWSGLDFVKIEPDLTTVDPDHVSALESNPDHRSLKEHTDHCNLKILKEEMSKMKRNFTTK